MRGSLRFLPSPPRADKTGNACVTVLSFARGGEGVGAVGRKYPDPPGTGEDLIGYAQVTPERWGHDWLHGPSTRGLAALKAAAKMAALGLAHPVSGYGWHAPALPYCDDPQRIVLGKDGRDSGPPVTLSLWGPCRKCEKCLLFRQLKWRERAMAELLATAARGNRSWWVTLTFSPVHLAGILAEAQAASGGQSVAAVDRAAYAHVQRFFKRVRKSGKCRFRYLAVYERGDESGRSHYHLLLHEQGRVPILKRTLEDQWHGFAGSFIHARLVHLDSGPGGLASYITKYATKSAEVRLRASQAYGRGDAGVSRQRRTSAGNGCPRAPGRA